MCIQVKPEVTQDSFIKIIFKTNRKKMLQITKPAIELNNVEEHTLKISK